MSRRDHGCAPKSLLLVGLLLSLALLGCREFAGYARGPEDSASQDVAGDASPSLDMAPRDAATDVPLPPDYALRDLGGDHSGLADLGTPDLCSTCVPGAKRCSGTAHFEVCQQDATGCNAWGIPANCPLGRHCRNGACVCDVVCVQGDTRCANNAVRQTCEEVAGCWVWGLSTSCPPGQTCLGGICESTSCTSGDSVVCHVGGCKGSATCAPDGQGFEPCVVDAGQVQPEICDGKDTNCDGLPDNGVAPKQCPLQLGVCAGAEVPCTNGHHPACGDWTYSAHTPSFELQEVSCDGLDNDCDGSIDEGLCAKPYHRCLTGSSSPTCYRCCGAGCPGSAPPCPGMGVCVDGLCRCGGKLCKPTERCVKGVCKSDST